MASYKIVEPCVYKLSGKVIHHTVPGAVVELDTAAARELGDKVEPVRKVREDTEGDDK